MIKNLNALLKVATHSFVALVVLLGFYYLKYRPKRTVAQEAVAVNAELRKQMVEKDTVIARFSREYFKLAKIPRYSIDQHLDRIKVKRNSKLEFVPTSAMVITDTLKTQGNDSLILDQRFLKDTIKQRNHWWQFWRKKRQPP